MIKKILVALSVSVILFNVKSFGLPNGVSGYTLKSGTLGCAVCHSTHSDPTSTVVVAISGPTLLRVNQTGNYSATIQGGSGTAIGVDIAASVGTLANTDNNLKILNGELTHPSKKSFSGGSYTFNFAYTAPAVIGSQTLFATATSRKTQWNFAPNFFINVYNPTMNAPTSLSAVFDTISRDRVYLNWNDNSNNELSFRIERKDGVSASFQLIGTVNAEVEQFTDSSNFIDSTNYSYRVYAVNADTVSGYSNVVQIFATVPVELVSFTGFIDGNVVTLNWSTASEINNKGFEVLRKIDELNWETISFVTGCGTTSIKIFYEYKDYLSEFDNEDKISYRLKQIDFSGEFTLSEIITVGHLQNSNRFSLGQNFPNPFNPSTQINFTLSNAANTELTIYDLLGNKVKTIINEFKAAGNYNVNFDGSNLTSGIYIYVLKTGNGSITRKMTLLK